MRKNIDLDHGFLPDAQALIQPFPWHYRDGGSLKALLNCKRSLCNEFTSANFPSQTQTINR